MAKYCIEFDYQCKYCSNTCECLTTQQCKKQIDLNPTPEMKIWMSNFLQQKKQNNTIIYYLHKLCKGK